MGMLIHRLCLLSLSFIWLICLKFDLIQVRINFAFRNPFGVLKKILKEKSLNWQQCQQVLLDLTQVLAGTCLFCDLLSYMVNGEWLMFSRSVGAVINLHDKGYLVRVRIRYISERLGPVSDSHLVWKIQYLLYLLVHISTYQYASKALSRLCLKTCSF